MTSDSWPFDPTWSGALVRVMIRDIDRRGMSDDDQILADLLCAAWPSQCAQDQ